ncbi:hypothetical protein Tco_1324818, partial [Tanacetum coccineum]
HIGQQDAFGFTFGFDVGPDIGRRWACGRGESAYFGGERGRFPCAESKCGGRASSV